MQLTQSVHIRFSISNDFQSKKMELSAGQSKCQIILENSLNLTHPPIHAPTESKGVIFEVTRSDVFFF